MVMGRPRTPVCEGFRVTLRAFRERSGLSQAELAERCHELAPEVAGINQPALSRWELGIGRREPSLSQLAVVATALQLSAEERAELLGQARAPVTA